MAFATRSRNAKRVCGVDVDDEAGDDNNTRSYKRTRRIPSVSTHKRDNTSTITTYTPQQYSLPPPWNDHALGIREVIDPMNILPAAEVAIISDYAAIRWKIGDRVDVMYSYPHSLTMRLSSTSIVLVFNNGVVKPGMLHGDSKRIMSAIPPQLRAKYVYDFNRLSLNVVPTLHFEHHLELIEAETETLARNIQIEMLKLQWMSECSRLYDEDTDKTVIKSILSIILDYVLIPHVPVWYTPPPRKVVLRKRTSKRKEKVKYVEQRRTLMMYSADEHLEESIQRTFVPYHPF